MTLDTLTPGRLQVVTDTPAALVVDVPPAGLRGFARGLFVSASIWTGICLMRSVKVVFHKGRDPSSWAVMIFLPLLAVGLAMFAAAWHYARRRASIAVSGDHLLIIESGPFQRTVQQEFTAEQLSRIDSASSISAVNGKPIVELHVLDREGTHHRFLSGQAAEDLAWLATVLRERLGLRETEEEDDEQEEETEEASDEESL